MNQLERFQQENPTTENIARKLFEECSGRLPPGVRVRNVAVWESPRCGARYTGE